MLDRAVPLNETDSDHARKNAPRQKIFAYPPIPFAAIVMGDIRFI
jgi:hypothetical protein